MKIKKMPERINSIGRDVLVGAQKKIKKEPIAIDLKDIHMIKKHNKQAMGMVDDVMDLFPDINLSIEIMTSLITAPNDMQITNLKYGFDNFSLPLDIQANVFDVIREHIDKEYKIKGKVDTIVRESLFTKGSYVELNIPSSNVLDLLKEVKTNRITKGIESIVDKRISHNDLISSGTMRKGNLTITSDPLVACKSDVLKYGSKVALENKIYKTTLSENKLTAALEASFKKEERILKLDGSTVTADKPIIKKIDSSKVIPVASKDNPKEHFGYFIVLDKHGNVLSDNNDDVNEENSSYSKKGNTVQGIVGRARELIKSRHGKTPVINNIDDVKNILLLEDLKDYLERSEFSSFVNTNVEIDDRLMNNILDYILNKVDVNILFIPEELVSYYAVNYRENGTGISLVEKVSTLISIRAIIMFTNILSFVKSSIVTTEVNTTLDPDDVNYRKSAEIIMEQVMQNRQVNLPIGIMKVDDLVDWIHKLGFSFNFKHPMLPDIDVEINEKSHEINPIDNELLSIIDKHIITTFYLTPEMVDNGYSPDFATTILANNLLLSKRVVMLQNIYNPQLTKDIRKKLKLDGRIKNKLIKVFTSNMSVIKRHMKRVNPDIDPEDLKNAKDEDIVDWIITNTIDNLTISLPEPEATEDTNEKDIIENYSDMLNSTVDKIFSTDLIPSELSGELGDNLDNIKDIIKVILIRDFMNKHNIMPELNKILTLDEDGKPVINVLDQYNAYLESISKIILPFMKANKKFIKKTDEKIDNLDNEEDETDDNEDDSSTDNNDDDTSSEDNKDTDDESKEPEEPEEEPKEDVNDDSGDGDTDDESKEPKEPEEEPEEPEEDTGDKPKE